MSIPEQHIIYTIGHSTRSMDEFIAMLQSFGIKQLVDIRSLPGSNKFPQFNKENLEVLLPEKGVKYIYMEDLGGRRKVRPDSKNTRWKNISFRGYADYMESETFKKAVVRLEEIALQAPTAYMCAEALWWRCHRSMVSDYLKAKGWTVLHIMDIDKVQEHSYTSPAKVSGSHVSYED
ncbi:MAG: DUF488 domain-containing protein [Dysgonamonadaceae bacterium]|jgi:uncharacterized protein (DUF488 family)|nr:DUF488 domain-containing protein [Dysgonamonadaceae bacterium]